jgi:hypothetical protein
MSNCWQCNEYISSAISVRYRGLCKSCITHGDSIITKEHNKIIREIGKEIKKEKISTFCQCSNCSKRTTKTHALNNSGLCKTCVTKRNKALLKKTKADLLHAALLKFQHDLLNP